MDHFFLFDGEYGMLDIDMDRTEEMGLLDTPFL